MSAKTLGTAVILLSLTWAVTLCVHMQPRTMQVYRGTPPPGALDEGIFIDPEATSRWLSINSAKVGQCLAFDGSSVVWSACSSEPPRFKVPVNTEPSNKTCMHRNDANDADDGCVLW